MAITSIVGTLIPQNKHPQEYYNAYGDFLYRYFDALDFFNMYHSWWFQFLLFLLTINIIICSIDRLSASWKIIFASKPHVNMSRFREHPDRKTFLSKHSPQELIDLYEADATKGFAYKTIESIENGYFIFAEKWRWTRLGVYSVHFSIILLLVGALIGSIFGFDGYVNIPEGEIVDRIQPNNHEKGRFLGFEIRCDNFDVSFYDTGEPKEFRSELTILERGKPVLQKDVIMNDPLRYKGINLYQSAYGRLEPITITLRFKSKTTGNLYLEKVRIDEQINLRESKGTFVIIDYMQSYNFMGRNLGEIFVGSFTPENGEPVEVILPIQFPTFDQMRNSDVMISVADYQFRYYTVLQVTKDPGVWIVYAGFIMIIMGCYVTFFMSHQQICIEVSKGDSGSNVIIAGISNKNQLAMIKKIENLSHKLNQLGNAHE